MSEDNFKVRTPSFRPYSDVRMLLTLLQGISKAAVKSMVASINEQKGTPQNPVDWSEPDIWIVERLHGNDAQLAQHIWQESHHTVSPRYIAGALYLIHLYGLLVPDGDGIYRITERGQRFLENDPQTVREIDEAEGILQLLTILATKSQAKRSDLLPEWGDYLHAYSKFGTEITIKDSLSRRLVNVVERGLFSQGCIDAALYVGAAPIGLIDGEKLLDLLIKYEIGVKNRPVSLYDIDEKYFQPTVEPDKEELYVEEALD